MVDIENEKEELSRQIDDNNKQIDELVKKNGELIQKKIKIVKDKEYAEFLHKTLNTLPECINYIGYYPPSNFDIDNQPKKAQKAKNPFLAMQSYNANLIEITRQVITKQFINTATDEIHKKAFELCLKSLNNMRKGNYPEETYAITPLEKPQYAKIWIITTAILVEGYDNLEALSYFNDCIEPFCLHFTTYAHYIIWAMRLEQFKEQKIPANHISRAKEPYVPLASTLNNLRNLRDINKLIEILQIPKELIGKKEYLRVPACNGKKHRGFYSFDHYHITKSIELLLDEVRYFNSVYN
ncbi:MAG: hypothetical protein LBJ88_04315 [Campylobacteraceae bacterium]|jgi:hypothetical protein|nr:hypothetical protein [Campylobacteraceae bacterium]